MCKVRGFFPILVVLCAFLLIASSSAYAQETTGGILGTIKDPSGAVIPGAHVSVANPSHVGNKEQDTDNSGNFHFINLPPDTYEITVTAKGFKTIKRGGVVLEVGHTLTVDLSMEMGHAETVIEVSSQAPVIDTTSTNTVSNVTNDVIQEVPHGLSYQSVIQFSPAARNEPLAGNNFFMGAGTGGSSISSSSNGQAYGYSVAGAADSENSYLVEGQDTSNIAGGYSMANVPFDFIQEVQIKSSGMEAEHGGSMGGVINVIMKKGGNDLHGQLVGQLETDQLDAGPNPYPRYNPASTGFPGTQVDATAQSYQPIKDHYRIAEIGGNIGGAIVKDRLFFFLGFEPQVNTIRRDVDWDYVPPVGTPIVGEYPFNQNSNIFYSTARLDYAATKRINLFASWLYQYQRMTGFVLPAADSTTGLLNVSSVQPITNFNPGIGYTAPNQTTNFGADISITPRLVSTTRFGIFVQDYHDFGYPEGYADYSFIASGVGATYLSSPGCNTTDTCATLPATSPLSQINQYNSASIDGTYTPHNLNKHYQLNEDVGWFKSGWWGTHNIKFGYQLNHLYNDTLQRSNLPILNVSPGINVGYAPATSTGVANCAAIEATTGLSDCVGTYGYAYIFDSGTDGKASNYNHALFAQDSWTVGRGITFNFGLRAEKEYLPAYQTFEGLVAKPINFSWSDKIAPRVGAAWDVLRNGKLKAFGSYGVYYDTMKLNLAISSFGGQYWNNCVYALNTDQLSALDLAYAADGRACEGLNPATPGNITAPTGDLTFIENVNNRTPEEVIPNLKPYRQHNVALGMDYQLKNDLALEVRWDRRRLDRAIEDAAMFSPTFGEVYTIVNPGYAPNNTFDGYLAYDYAINDALYGCSTPGSCTTGANGALTSEVPFLSCPTCPPPPKAIRNYDGVEIRVTKSLTHNWFGMFSYTYSSLWGNYTGLTSTDQSDSASLYGGGRASPNNSRYFDEPWFSYTANGTSDAGPLATDRPNVFKGYAYYNLKEGKRNSTNFGIFQYLYQGSPLTSYADVGYYYGGFGGQIDQYIVGRGNWVYASQDPSCVAATNAALAANTTPTTDCPITVSNVASRRTPWYIQSDFQLQHEIKLGANESKALRFEITVPNIFNQKAVTAYNAQIDSGVNSSFIAPGGLGCSSLVPSAVGCTVADGGAFYNAVMHPYDWKTNLNTTNYIYGDAVTLNSNYGKPLYYQLPRTMRLGLRFTF